MKLVVISTCSHNTHIKKTFNYFFTRRSYFKGQLPHEASQMSINSPILLERKPTHIQLFFPTEMTLFQKRGSIGTTTPLLVTNITVTQLGEHTHFLRLGGALL